MDKTGIKRSFSDLFFASKRRFLDVLAEDLSCSCVSTDSSVNHREVGQSMTKQANSTFSDDWSLWAGGRVYRWRGIRRVPCRGTLPPNRHIELTSPTTTTMDCQLLAGWLSRHCMDSCMLRCAVLCCAVLCSDVGVRFRTAVLLCSDMGVRATDERME
eukprot:COSAG06_NODE_16524_length_995_cov_2.900780_3_plen_158_part_00